MVGAPLIAECYANFECQLVDDSQVDRYSLFIFRVRQGARRHIAEVPEDGPLPRRRGVHDLGREQELPAEVQAGDAVACWLDDRFGAAWQLNLTWAQNETTTAGVGGRRCGSATSAASRGSHDNSTRKAHDRESPGGSPSGAVSAAGTCG
jgi:hypothetical protein